MDIELLKTFLAVRKIRHFGQVAQQMSITQAAVSLRIKQLENLLGAPLFVRFRNNLQLTETGERLVNYAENIVGEWERAQQDISLRKHSDNILRFGARNGFCAYLLKKSLGTVFDNFSDTALRVESLDEESLRSKIREKRIDLALMYEPLKDREFMVKAISSIELVLVSTVQGQTTEAAMQGEYVSLEWRSFFNARFLELSSLMPDPVMQTTDTAMALQFLLDHGGSAYLPYRLVQEHLGSALYRVEDAKILHHPIYAIYRQLSPIRKEIDKTVDLLIENSIPEFSSMKEILKEADPARARKYSSAA